MAVCAFTVGQESDALEFHGLLQQSGDLDDPLVDELYMQQKFR